MFKAQSATANKILLPWAIHRLLFDRLELILDRLLDHDVDDIRSMEWQVLAELTNPDEDLNYADHWLCGKPVGGAVITLNEDVTVGPFKRPAVAVRSKSTRWGV